MQRNPATVFSQIGKFHSQRLARPATYNTNDKHERRGTIARVSELFLLHSMGGSQHCGFAGDVSPTFDRGKASRIDFCHNSTAARIPAVLAFRFSRNEFRLDDAGTLDWRLDRNQNLACIVLCRLKLARECTDTQELHGRNSSRIGQS